MNTHTELSAAIAHSLVDMWSFHKSEAFVECIAKTYRKHVTCPPSFECIYIAEAESGDLDEGAIGGIIKKWWMVNDKGLTEIRGPQLPMTDDSTLFDRRPVLKFFTDGERIVLGERLGPNLICRRTGKLVLTKMSSSITDIRLLWATNDEHLSIK